MAEINSKVEQLFNAFSHHNSTSSQLLSSTTTTTISQCCLPTLSSSTITDPMLIFSSSFSQQQPYSSSISKIYTMPPLLPNLQTLKNFNINDNSDPADLMSKLHQQQDEQSKTKNLFEQATATSSISSLLQQSSIVKQHDSPLQSSILPFSSNKTNDSAKVYELSSSTTMTSSQNPINLFSLFNSPSSSLPPSSLSQSSNTINCNQMSPMVTTLESIENNVLRPFMSSNSTKMTLPSLVHQSTESTSNSIAIPITPNNNNMSQSLKSFLLNEHEANDQQQESFKNTDFSSNIGISGGSIADNICSSLSSSSSSESSQFSPPLALISDLVHETITFEHTEDFIKSLKIPLDVLDDLASRFVLNMPQEEKYDPIRICFQMENAFWHYLDFCCEYNSRLPKFKFKRFAQIMFTYVPRLRQFLDVFDDVVNKWIQYKFSIPCSGAIMLDETMDYILLVQGYGSKTWGFPKGKVNHDESLMNCAVREVFEETGYNCMGNIFETHYLERKIFESRLRLYLIKNVDFNFDFKPQARNEIRSIKWFALKDFPHQDQKKAMMASSYGHNGCGVSMPQNASKFVSVMPFIPAIRKWVENEKRKQKIAKKRDRRQQMKQIKQQQLLEQLEGHHSTSKSIMGSNSSSPISTIEDVNESNTLVAEENQSATFVDVDLNAILGYREMYNVKDDQRELLTREQKQAQMTQTDKQLRNDKKNVNTGFQSTFQAMSNNNNMKSSKDNCSTICNGNDDIQAQQMSNTTNCQLPQAGTLEDIEKALIKNATKTETIESHLDNDDDMIDDINSTVLLGSKGSCNKKLNFLFGLAQRQTLTSPNPQFQMISNNGRPFSSMSVNSSNGINNKIEVQTKNDIVPTKPMDPIGTKRSSSISFVPTSKQQDNHQKTCSGQTVISMNTTTIMKSSKTNNNDIKPLLNGLFTQTNIDSDNVINGNNNPIENLRQKPKILSTTTLLKNVNCRNDSARYNGLETKTISLVHPKIELLLQRLKAINNTA